MNTCLRVIVMVAVLASLAAGAQERSEVSSDPWQKSVGGLYSVMFLTDDGEAYFKDVSSSEGELALPPSTEAAGSDALLAAGVFFRGCMPNTKGLCDLSVEFSVLAPDGTLHKALGLATEWRNRPAPRASRMSVVGVMIGQIGPAAPSGRYTVRAVVRDHNAVIDLQLERMIVIKQGTDKK